jgi:hypothetical protein
MMLAGSGVAACARLSPSAARRRGAGHKASGKSRVVVMRYAGNTRLKTACYHWARVAMQTIAAHRHTRRCARPAIRTRAGVAIACWRWARMLRTGTLYDPQRPRRIGGNDARAYPPPSRPSPSAGPAQAANAHA